MNASNECTAQNAGNRAEFCAHVASEMHHQAMTNEIVSRVVVKVDFSLLLVCSPTHFGDLLAIVRNTATA